LGWLCWSPASACRSQTPLSGGTVVSQAEDEASRFPFSLPSTCQPTLLGKPCGCWGVGRERRCRRLVMLIRAARWNASPKPCARKGNARSDTEASALSHLISSFAAFRGRFNLPGSGKRLTLRRAGCIPMARGSPRASGLVLWQLPGMPAGKPVPSEAAARGTGTRTGPGALAGPCHSNPAGP